MQQTKERWTHMDSIGDDADQTPGGIKPSRGLLRAAGQAVRHPKQDVVVPVQRLRTGVPEMGETGRAGSEGGVEDVGRGVSVSEAHLYAQAHGAADGLGGARALRCECDEQAIGPSRFPKLS
jgi:hypothetical protein